MRSLEAQLDLAERKLREYRGEIEKSGSVFLGDNSEFLRMISNRENAADASFMGKNIVFIYFKIFYLARHG